ncbi:exported hypothetical protein [Paraburkholderia ribeironis]|uniref:Uncharacterized protein n=1 Tax=Paraburkholderia ribeironis TaxID=1247936 RepID=A0A1N7SDD3_9BURK|nr:hypothetical protein [Paraburkholderia ribeironis]SIT45344.1 exported hypothetical protein [Paraburkholderia ribeironis]
MHTLIPHRTNLPVGTSLVAGSSPFALEPEKSGAAREENPVGVVEMPQCLPQGDTSLSQSVVHFSRVSSAKSESSAKLLRKPSLKRA